MFSGKGGKGDVYIVTEEWGPQERESAYLEISSNGRTFFFFLSGHFSFPSRSNKEIITFI